MEKTKMNKVQYICCQVVLLLSGHLRLLLPFRKPGAFYRTSLSSKSHSEAANLVAGGMAVILQGKGLEKLRLAIRNQIRLGSLSGPSISSHRATHGFTYDKNAEEQVHPSAVPDDVIQAQSDKYWAPHPKTGVFGPMDVTHLEATTDYTPTPTSVSEPKVWFRPLEDVEKPQPN